MIRVYKMEAIFKQCYIIWQELMQVEDDKGVSLLNLPTNGTLFLFIQIH